MSTKTLTYDTVGTENAVEIIEQLKYSIQVMRKYKRDHCLIGGITLFIGTDVFDLLQKYGVIKTNTHGKHSLGDYPVKVVHDYYAGYISVE